MHPQVKKIILLIKVETIDHFHSFNFWGSSYFVYYKVRVKYG